MRVLMITSEWPTDEQPHRGSFIVQRVAALREAGVAVEVFSFQGRGHPFNYVKAWRALRAGHRLEDFDVVHAQFGQSGLVAGKTPAPLVVTFRGSDVAGVVGARGRYTFQGRLLSRISQSIARRADAVIVVAEHLARFLPAGVAPHVIPSGLDLDLFRPMPKAEARRALGWPPDKAYVLFAAGPDNPVKRYPLAQQAVGTLGAQGEVALVVLSGVPRVQVPIYMNAADVVLLTSKHEGSPNVVKEALACDVPVVSVDVGDVRQRIGAVDGCIVCRDDAPETIGNAVATVLREQSRIEGREAVRALDERLMARNVIAVYQAVLGREG